MEQTVKHTESVKLPFSRPTLKRLERVNEAALIKALNDIDADEEMVHAMGYLEKHEPDATHTQPYSELRKELKEEGLL